MIFNRPILLAACLLAASSLRGQSSVPTLAQALPAQTLALGAAPATIDLRSHFIVPGLLGSQFVQFNTVLGRFNVELRNDAAPRHVANFLTYVQAGDYANTFFHRAASFEDNGQGPVSIIQAGGYRITNALAEITRRTPVALEYNLPNKVGSLAAARTNDINSATSEWYFNVRDNTTTLGPANGGGYSVFGQVVGTGISVINAIAAIPRYNVVGTIFSELPARNVTGNDLSEANLLLVSSISQVSLFPTGTGGSIVEFSFQVSDPNVALVAVSGSALTITPVRSGSTSVTVRAADVNGNAATGSFLVTVSALPSPPVISAQPVSQTVTTGSTVVFTAGAAGSPVPAYQWRRNGADIPGATAATLVLSGTSGANAALAGSYAVVATNGSGSTTSTAATLNVSASSDAGRLSNLSIRTALASGETMTIGTVLGGGGTNGAKPLLARAVGPTLGAEPPLGFGLSGVLPDPTLALISTSASPGTTVAVNNDWGGGTALSGAFAQFGAFALAAANSKDAAIYQTGASALAPGNYTVQVSDAGGAAGTVIAELYDATPTGSFNPATPRLVNVSVLKTITAGDSLTAGFFVGGTTARTVLIRAIGPALGAAPFNLTDAMPDPKLTLYNSSGAVIATNDDWGGDPQISAAGGRVGAFVVGNGASKDAMLLLTLAPGATYTAQVSPVGAGGTVIVEVYEVP